MLNLYRHKINCTCKIDSLGAIACYETTHFFLTSMYRYRESRRIGVLAVGQLEKFLRGVKKISIDS